MPSATELKYNKGEWSEFYTFLDVLGSGQLQIGNSKIEPLDEYYTVINVYRDDPGYMLVFSIDEASGLVRIAPENDRIIINERAIPMQRFTDMAGHVLREIRLGSKTFSIEGVQEFLSEIGCTNVKYGRHDSKIDIDLQLRDFHTGLNHRLGFSIKSQLGGSSTLLNASQATRFRFDVDYPGADCRFIETFNGSRVKLRKKLAEYSARGMRLSFRCMHSETYDENLVLIDTVLPRIIAAALVEYYVHGKRDVSEATAELIRSNPIDVPTGVKQRYYPEKMRGLLRATALGMVPGTRWDGRQEATGGYIIVSATGDVVCFSRHNDDEFRDYLYENTRFDTPSTTRNHIGVICRDREGMYIDLALQIRFSDGK
ncbi:MAG: HpaII family restriction endonuclease [Actinomycetes bacterium]|jgi:type II restriction enzyme|nr:HpaII family restriction endonuclease [Actinomycetes bacterium]